MVLKKQSGGGAAEVTCDLRRSGLPASSEFRTTIPGTGEGRVTLPLVGSSNDVPAGALNLGVRCWAVGNVVSIEKADLHAVVYDAPPM